MKTLKDLMRPGVTEVQAMGTISKVVAMEFENFHTEKSILSEHYGFTDALLEDTCVCKWQMVCLCSDCECNFCYSERRLKEVKNG